MLFSSTLFEIRIQIIRLADVLEAALLYLKNTESGDDHCCFFDRYMLENMYMS